MKKQRRRIRNRLIYSGFQIRYTLLLVGAPLFVFVILGYLYHKEIEAQDAMLMNLETTQALLLGQEAEEEAPGGLVLEEIEQFIPDEVRYLEELEMYLHGEQNLRILVLLAGFGLLFVVLFFVGIILTHRIAGPIIATDRILAGIAAGELNEVRRFRKRDEFRFLDQRIQILLASLRIREQQDIEALERVRKAVGEDPAQNACREQLDALLAIKRRRDGESTDPDPLE